MTRGAKIEVECDHCNSAFTARAADRARGWARFCSKRCRSYALNPSTKPKIPRVKHGSKTHEIVTEAALQSMHSGCWPDGTMPREVLNTGIKKIAIGFHNGSTVTSILQGHQLLGTGQNPRITARGFHYLRALYHEEGAKIAVRDVVTTIEAFKLDATDPEAVAASAILDRLTTLPRKF